MLRSALFNHSGTVEFLKEMNISDCFTNLKTAWENLKDSTLNKIWKPLLGESCIIKQDPTLANLLSISQNESSNASN